MTLKVDDGDGLGGVKIMCHEPLATLYGHDDRGPWGCLLCSWSYIAW